MQWSQCPITTLQRKNTTAKVSNFLPYSGQLMLRFFNNTDVLSSNILNFTFSYTQEYSGKYGYKSTIMCKNNTILYDKPGRWSVYRSCRTSTDSLPRVMPRCCCTRSGSLLTSYTRLSPHPSAARPCPETSAQKQHPHKFSSSKTHYSSTFSALTLLAGCQEEHPAVKIEWWSVGVVICLVPDCLHVVQLMPLPSQNPIISSII